MGDSNSDGLDIAGKVALGVGGAALAAAGVLMAKSGVMQSAAAKMRRNGEGRLVDAPRAGVPLLVSLAGIAEHSGIFLGVRAPTRFFNYALADEKIARLRREGRLQQ